MFNEEHLSMNRTEVTKRELKKEIGSSRRQNKQKIVLKLNSKNNKRKLYFYLKLFLYFAFNINYKYDLLVQNFVKLIRKLKKIYIKKKIKINKNGELNDVLVTFSE